MEERNSKLWFRAKQKKNENAPQESHLEGNGRKRRSQIDPKKYQNGPSVCGE